MVEGVIILKEMICTGAGIIGAGLAWLFGGWDAAFVSLLVCIGIDYISGSLLALVFHKSTKTASGAYNSAYGLKGLCKKCLMLLFVVVGVQADRLLGADYVRDAICIGFSINEILSITENLGHAGVPMPKAVKEALEQLHNHQ
jgi:toxin secretion/phage lysis holin